MPRKGENIYKRKDGRWEGRFRKYRDANGKIKYGYVYARSYTEVKIKLNKIKQEITIPAESGTADIIVRTFSEVVKEWITYKTPLLKESSVAKYTNIINLHLLPFFHEQTMQSISVQRLEEFYKKLLLKVTPKGTLLAPKTTLDILSVMKSILVYAKELFAFDMKYKEKRRIFFRVGLQENMLEKAKQFGRLSMAQKLIIGSLRTRLFFPVYLIFLLKGKNEKVKV